MPKKITASKQLDEFDRALHSIDKADKKLDALLILMKELGVKLCKIKQTRK